MPDTLAAMFRVIVLTILCAALTFGGCVEREMTITSDPPGALVLVSDEEKGRTPVTFEFVWYGDYDIILRLEGYETLKTAANINPPWYEIPPVDLLSELAPWTYRDRRFLHYTLVPRQAMSPEKLIEQARELERQNRQPVQT